MPRYWRLASCAIAVSCVAGCSSNPKVQTSVAAPTTPPVRATVSPTPEIDPASILIAEAEHHFEIGQGELTRGHLTEARDAFNRALDVFLTAPQGPRTDPRLREALDRLIDRIGSLESAALAAADGFAETAREPASIDELLATSAFEGVPPPPAPELTKTVEDDLAATAHDIPIPMHNRVLAYVEALSGHLREWMHASLQRGTRYLPMIQNVFRAEGLPLDLAYVPIIESAFKPNAVSRANARGVWQFMRDTARDMGLRQDWYVDERADPEKATIAAAKYLKWLHGLFDGDWHLALASYNGGPGRVQRAMKRAGLTDFWSLSSSAQYLPRETREYVPMILAAVIIARNPLQYGFDIEPAEPMAYERVSVPGASDLRRVAEWIQTPVSELQALNPELRRWTTPVRVETYDIKVPVGAAETVRARLAAAPPTELSAVRWHTVKRGETLATIARRFKVSRAELAQANDLKATARLRSGQEIAIPRAPSAVLASTQLRAAAKSSQSDGALTASASSDRVATYTVRKGDTLYSIARRFDTTVDALKSLNRLIMNRIMPGDRLRVAATVAASAQ
jgi:membrane-bound lytic murein transglycosylase D